MLRFIKQIIGFLKKDLWNIDLKQLTRPKIILIKTLRLISFTVRELINNELQLRAVSLVYTTLLSIVPLIAFSFSILQSFGVVNNQLEPILTNFLAPLGQQGEQISSKEVPLHFKGGDLGVGSKNEAPFIVSLQFLWSLGNRTE